jgi:hypothetical protein
MVSLPQPLRLILGAKAQQFRDIAQPVISRSYYVG